MDKLNFQKFDFSFKNKENKTYILDPIRKKWLILTPEEWVRQHCIIFLSKIKNIPLAFIQVEKKLNLNGSNKRYDLGEIKKKIKNKTKKIILNNTNNTTNLL